MPRGDSQCAWAASLTQEKPTGEPADSNGSPVGVSACAQTDDQRLPIKSRHGGIRNGRAPSAYARDGARGGLSPTPSPLANGGRDRGDGDDAMTNEIRSRGDSASRRLVHSSGASFQ